MKYLLLFNLLFISQTLCSQQFSKVLRWSTCPDFEKIYPFETPGKNFDARNFSIGMMPVYHVNRKTGIRLAIDYTQYNYDIKGGGIRYFADHIMISPKSSIKQL